MSLHPTVKPVAMIADAIRDVSGRNGLVLDLFGGSGSTLIAAHKTGRRARLCELDPIYCDRTIRRWERYAKDDALQVACGLPEDHPARGGDGLKGSESTLERTAPVPPRAHAPAKNTSAPRPKRRSAPKPTGKVS